jgi:hypothetical protein
MLSNTTGPIILLHKNRHTCYLHILCI